MQKMHEVAKCVQWVLICECTCLCMLPSGFTSRLHFKSSPPNVRPSWLPWHVINTVTRYEISLNFVIVTDVLFVLFLLFDWFYLTDAFLAMRDAFSLKHLWFCCWQPNMSKWIWTTFGERRVFHGVLFFGKFPSGSKKHSDEAKTRKHSDTRDAHIVVSTWLLWWCANLSLSVPDQENRVQLFRTSLNSDLFCFVCPPETRNLQVWWWQCRTGGVVLVWRSLQSHCYFAVCGWSRKVGQGRERSWRYDMQLSRHQQKRAVRPRSYHQRSFCREKLWCCAPDRPIFIPWATRQMLKHRKRFKAQSKRCKRPFRPILLIRSSCSRSKCLVYSPSHVKWKTVSACSCNVVDGRCVLRRTFAAKGILLQAGTLRPAWHRLRCDASTLRLRLPLQEGAESLRKKNELYEL